MSSKASHDIGWIGLGRMGEAMAARLVKAGHGLSVWNRTASKADPLAQIGAEVVTDKAAMAHCATVFTMVSTTDDLKDILFGTGGVLTGNARPERQCLSTRPAYSGILILSLAGTPPPAPFPPGAATGADAPKTPISWSSSAKWHADQCSGSTSRSKGSSTLQISCA